MPLRSPDGSSMAAPLRALGLIADGSRCPNRTAGQGCGTLWPRPPTLDRRDEEPSLLLVCVFRGTDLAQLQQWVDYHLLLGATRIGLIDNSCDGGLAARRAALQRYHGLVVHITEFGCGVQLSNLESFPLERYGCDMRWRGRERLWYATNDGSQNLSFYPGGFLGCESCVRERREPRLQMISCALFRSFGLRVGSGAALAELRSPAILLIDDDEYVMLSEPSARLSDVVRSLVAARTCTLSLSWRSYGHSGHICQPKSERFFEELQKRAPLPSELRGMDRALVDQAYAVQKQHHLNPFVGLSKKVLLLSDVTQGCTHHVCSRCTAGFTCDGTRAQCPKRRKWSWKEFRRTGQADAAMGGLTSPEPNASGLRIWLAHYSYQSEARWQQKRKRGRVSVGKKKRTLATPPPFFNTITDDSVPRSLEQRLARERGLSAELRTCLLRQLLGKEAAAGAGVDVGVGVDAGVVVDAGEDMRRLRGKEARPSRARLVSVPPPQSPAGVGSTSSGLAPSAPDSSRIAITFSPSTPERARRMLAWLAPAGADWCIAELPVVHPSSFWMNRTTAEADDIFYLPGGRSAPERFFRVPQEHVTEKEAHKVASAYVHLRAMRCFASRSCHPCFRGARWLFVAEDDILPSTSPVTAPWRHLPRILLRALAHLNSTASLRMVNKLMLISKGDRPDERGEARFDVSEDVRRCREWERVPSLGTVPPANSTATWQPSTSAATWLARCHVKSAQAYMMRRDQAERVLREHSVYLRLGVAHCADPWHSDDGSCGKDPSLFKHNFKRCQRAGKSCLGMSLLLRHSASDGPHALAPGHDGRRGPARKARVTDLFKHVNTHRFTNYSQFPLYASTCGTGVARGTDQARDSRGCKTLTAERVATVWPLDDMFLRLASSRGRRNHDCTVLDGRLISVLGRWANSVEDWQLPSQLYVPIEALRHGSSVTSAGGASAISSGGSSAISAGGASASGASASGVSGEWSRGGRDVVADEVLNDCNHVVAVPLSLSGGGTELWLPCGFEGHHVGHETSTNVTRIVNTTSLEVRAGPRIEQAGGACAALALPVGRDGEERVQACAIGGTDGNHNSGRFLDSVRCFSRVSGVWHEPTARLPLAMDHGNAVLLPAGTCNPHDPPRVLLLNFRTHHYANQRTEVFAVDLDGSIADSTSARQRWGASPHANRPHANRPHVNRSLPEWYLFANDSDSLPRDAAGVVLAASGRVILSFGGVYYARSHDRSVGEDLRSARHAMPGVSVQKTKWKPLADDGGKRCMNPDSRNYPVPWLPNHSPEP